MNPCKPCFYITAVGLPSVLILLALCIAVYILYLHYRGPRTKPAPTWKRILPLPSLSGSISYPESCLSFNLENWETSTRKSEDCFKNEDDVRIAVGDRLHFLRNHYYNENVVQGANFYWFNKLYLMQFCGLSFFLLKSLISQI